MGGGELYDQPLYGFAAHDPLTLKRCTFGSMSVCLKQHISYPNEISGSKLSQLTGLLSGPSFFSVVHCQLQK